MLLITETMQVEIDFSAENLVDRPYHGLGADWYIMHFRFMTADGKSIFTEHVSELQINYDCDDYAALKIHCLNEVPSWTEYRFEPCENDGYMIFINDAICHDVEIQMYFTAAVFGFDPTHCASNELMLSCLLPYRMFTTFISEIVRGTELAWQVRQRYEAETGDSSQRIRVSAYYPHILAQPVPRP